LTVTQPLFKWIKSEDLADGYDFSIEVDVNNATPAAMAAAEQSFTKFLALVQGFPMIAASPVLIREAAFRSGYKNEAVIQQMQKVAKMAMLAKAQQVAGQQPGNQAVNGTGGGANTAAAQMQTPNPEQIATQLQRQV
ncbi:MAG: hypothetical protein ACREHG_06855, partial [Candidatus Saccharimonadales bacterium]